MPAQVGPTVVSLVHPITVVVTETAAQTTVAQVIQVAVAMAPMASPTASLMGDLKTRVLMLAAELITQGTRAAAPMTAMAVQTMQVGITLFRPKRLIATRTKSPRLSNGTKKLVQRIQAAAGRLLKRPKASQR
tara:strand:- start:50 stop:448 length:399 start_codon:yes stop_codon:yes gene_type:complete